VFNAVFALSLVVTISCSNNEDPESDESSPTPVETSTSHPSEITATTEITQLATPIAEVTPLKVAPTPTVVVVKLPTVLPSFTPTATATATVSPSKPTAMPVATPTATTSAIPTPIPTQTVVATLVPEPTLVPAPTATIVVVPTEELEPTATPRPANTATPSPTPTSTAVPVPDDRYGVVVSGAPEYPLDKLGTTWYLDYSPNVSQRPSGTNKVGFISVKPGNPRISESTLSNWATAAPGSVWYIGGEPNIGAQDGISPAAFVTEFDYYYDAIKGADPTAKITSPSVLNWDFTCVGCGGFTTGHSWMSQFVAAYAAAHSGSLPPVDIWAIDLYPLRWNEVPMVDDQILIDQLESYRSYLSFELGLPNAPIWITEIASHWAYSSIGFDANGYLDLPPELDWDDDYEWDVMSGFLTRLMDWLDANGPANNIERWFLYTTWIDIQNAGRINYGYAGIYLLDGPQSGAALTPLGQIYSDYARGIR